MMQFFASGKLLLTGEYVVLDGAKALALPTKFGQYLRYETLENEQNIIVWKAFLRSGDLWFSAEIDLQKNEIVNSTNEELASSLLKIFNVIRFLNPEILTSSSWKVETQLTFEKDWGLGSSSTLIANLAHLFEVDAYDLLQKTLGGSGYDIACAQLGKPLSFQLSNQEKKIAEIQLSTEITQNCYFLYLNQKQNSREGIAQYKAKELNKSLIQQITQISDQVLQCNDLQEFESLMLLHEKLIGEKIQIPTVAEKLFPDYQDGIIKSLGAWGGDFVLYTGKLSSRNYFEQKGYSVIFSYNDLILS